MILNAKEKMFKENFERLKNLYNILKQDEESVLFASEKLNKQLIKKIKRSQYEKDSVFNYLYDKVKDVNIEEENTVPIVTPFIENKRNIDKSTLYSFNGPFQLLHADIANIRFFSKSAADPKYCLLFVDLFTQKIYTYPMKKRNILKKKMEEFYEEVSQKRKEIMRLQTDLEFQQNEIKKLNRKYKVEMFSTRVRGGKAFAAEQKIREFKKILLKVKTLYQRTKMKLKPNELIRKVATNMNKTKTKKYQIEPENVEKKALTDDNFREKFDFYRLAKVGKENKRHERYMTKKDSYKRKTRDPLNIGEKVLVLSERLKKKDAPGKLYKASTQNKAFYNKDKVFIIRKRFKSLDNLWYYWISEANKKIIGSRFIRQELFALKEQWM